MESKAEKAKAKCLLQVLIALTDKVKADVPLIVRRPPIISDNSTRCTARLLLMMS